MTLNVPRRVRYLVIPPTKMSTAIKCARCPCYRIPTFGPTWSSSRTNTCGWIWQSKSNKALTSCKNWTAKKPIKRKPGTLECQSRSVTILRSIRLSSTFLKLRYKNLQNNIGWPKSVKNSACPTLTFNRFANTTLFKRKMPNLGKKSIKWKK